MKKNLSKNIIFTSFVLTLLIFFFGIVISYGLDFVRIGEISETISSYKLTTDAYLVEKDFRDTFGEDTCGLMQSRVLDLKKEVEGVGTDLSKYGQKSFFKKQDFDYLKRKYFLLQLKLYNWIQESNDNCGNSYVPILFFYEIDDDLSERQGYILTDLTKAYPLEVIVFSFDKDYQDEPLVQLLVQKYNITKTPAIVIHPDIKKEGLTYLKEIEVLTKAKLSRVDVYGKSYDFDFTLKATQTNKDLYIKRLENQIKETKDPFALGDLYLILGRLLHNDNVICQSSEFYKQVSEKNKEEKALAYETLASLNCEGKQSEYYIKAADLWRELGNYFRTEVDKNLADNTPLSISYDLEDLPEISESFKNWNELIIGNSSFTITEEDIIISQTDRVTRDWLSGQLNQSPFGEDILTVFSEQFTLPKEELFPELGWHEGGRIKELKMSGARHIISSGTLVKKINGKWYAPDETGIFRFEVPLDKILYPTTRFLKEGLAVIIDSHGINTMVEQAIRNKATVVIGCGDNPGKAKAARYLASKGIKVITFTDKYFYLLLDEQMDVFGSPPMEKRDGSFVIGGRPLTITKKDKIIVMNISSDALASSYYGTPALYFSNLQKKIHLDLEYVTITGYNQMKKIIKEAEDKKSRFIAVRVYNKEDYEPVRSWLEKDNQNKAILFHSMAYPYGYKLFMEFPEQTSFGDLNPIIT